MSDALFTFMSEHRQAIELVAAVLGLINVALVVRRSLWNYPFGIAMVALYFFVFAEARLYSDALLQIFFLTIQAYGWVNWRASQAEEGSVVVASMRTWPRIHWLAGTAIAAILWGTLMHRMTDAAAPYIDAAVAAASVAAQLLQSLRRIESWVLWIAVDVVAIGLFWSRGLEVTAFLYALFLILSIIGLTTWLDRLRFQRSGAAAAV